MMWYAIPVAGVVAMLFFAPADILLALGIVVVGGLAAVKLTEWMRRR